MGEADQKPDGGGLLKHTSIYAIAPLVQRVLALLFVHVYTQRLTPGEFGILAAADVFIGLVPILLGASLLAGVGRFYFVKETEAERGAMVSGAAVVLVLGAWIGVAVALLLRVPLAALIFGDHGEITSDSFVTYLVICALMLPFAMATRTGIEYLQVQKRSRATTTVQLAKTLFEAGLKVYMLFVLEWGVMGFLLSVLIGEAISGTLFVIWILTRLGVQVRWPSLKPLVIYALPLVPVALFQLGLHQGDRLLLANLGPQDIVGEGEDGAPLTRAKEWLGIYQLGYQLAFLFHTAVMASFMRIWAPHVYGITDPSRRKTEFRRVGTMVGVGLATCYAQVALFSRQGIRVLTSNDEYFIAERVVPLIAVAYLAYALYALAQAALMSVFATRLLMAINLVAVAVNFGINYALIPANATDAYMSCAHATVVSFVLLAAMAAVAARAKGVQSFEMPRAMLAGGMVVAAGFVGTWVDSWGGAFEPASLAAKAGASLVTLACAWLLLSEDGRNVIRARVPRPIGRTN